MCKNAWEPGKTCHEATIRNDLRKCGKMGEMGNLESWLTFSFGILVGDIFSQANMYTRLPTRVPSSCQCLKANSVRR
jgi:hypothetical protein